MATRGLWGFLIDGKHKVTYNHQDSYPKGLGKQIINFIRECSDVELYKIAQRIILVDPETIPTKEQITQYVKYSDRSVSTRSLKEWYVLLRGVQFHPEYYKHDKDLIHMIELEFDIKNLDDYSYVMDVDNSCLLFYTGKVLNNTIPFSKIRRARNLDKILHT